MFNKGAPASIDHWIYGTNIFEGKQLKIIVGYSEYPYQIKIEKCHVFLSKNFGLFII